MIDAVVAVAILCIALASASLAVGAMSHSLRTSYAAVVSGVAERGNHEVHAFDGK